jgi:hypothetical protein
VAEGVSGEQAGSSGHPQRQHEELKNGALTFTQVRRSLRLNDKSTTPLAKMSTPPFPFAAGRHFAFGNERAVVLLAKLHLTNTH